MLSSVNSDDLVLDRKVLQCLVIITLIVHSSTSFCIWRHQRRSKQVAPNKLPNLPTISGSNNNSNNSKPQYSTNIGQALLMEYLTLTSFSLGIFLIYLAIKDHFDNAEMVRLLMSFPIVISLHIILPAAAFIKKSDVRNTVRRECLHLFSLY